MICRQYTKILETERERRESGYDRHFVDLQCIFDFDSAKAQQDLKYNERAGGAWEISVRLATSAATLIFLKPAQLPGSMSHMLSSIVVTSPQQPQSIIPTLDYSYVAHRPTRITPAATNFEILALMPGFLICSCSAAGSL